MLCDTEAADQLTNDISPPIRPPTASAIVRLGAQLLREARNHAVDRGVDVWQFAVELSSLCQRGVSHNDLRWLLSRGYIEHAAEITQLGQPERAFRSVGSLMLPERTCLVLTLAGADWLAKNGGHPTAQSSAVLPMSSPHRIPVWDSELRELRVDGLLVKQFRQPATSQEKVISAFAEEGWPIHIDDPLSPVAGRNSKRHLHDTINNLNRNQRHRLLRFQGDGSGQGVYWSFATPELR